MSTVDVNLSEEEQVEQLKKWWKENGVSVVAGIVLGLGGVLGWQYWTQHQQTIAGQAAAQFVQVNNSMASNENELAAVQAEGVINNYSDTSYALFAALDLAKLKLEQGDRAAAKERLQWVMDSATEASLQQVARLRLTRILVAEGDTDGAGALIAAAPADSFKSAFSELKGDVALLKGDKDAARQAYQEALAQDPGNQALVQMKFDDLAVSAN